MCLENYCIRLILALGVPVIHVVIEIYLGTVLPLEPLNAYPDLWRPVSPDSVMGGSHNFDVNPTLDTSTCTVVGFLPLG